MQATIPAKMRLPAFPGVEFSISVDKQDLQENEDREAAGAESMGSRFVEAVQGANFAVEFRTDAQAKYRQDHLAFEVELDGVRATTVVISPQPEIGGHSSRMVDTCVECHDGEW